MQFKDEGYIAAIRRYGENSLIVNVITKEHGLIGGFVKGGGAKRTPASTNPATGFPSTLMRGSKKICSA